MRDWAHSRRLGTSSRRSWLCRSASAPSQRACEAVQDRCLEPCSRPRHAAAWGSRNRAPAGWVAWATNAITEGRTRFRIGTQWFSRSGCWNRRGRRGPLRSWQAGAVQFTAKICGLVGRATMADPLSAGGAFSSLSARCFLSRIGEGKADVTDIDRLRGGGASRTCT